MSQNAELPPLQILVLERVDPAKNVSRYYVLSIAPSLVGDTILTRKWGRIGGSGRQAIALFERPDVARLALADWFRRKSNRGYRVVHAGSEATNSVTPQVRPSRQVNI